MADNAQKTPIARTLNRFAENKVRGALSLLGQSLPASVISRAGAIVTVRFEVNSAPFTLPNVTVPMIGSEYIRLPIQAGCKGWVLTADAYLGGMSGLGGGAAGLVPRANLSALVWSPIGNSAWDAAEDPNKIVLYGPDGAILRTLDKACSVAVSATGVVVKVPAGKTLQITTLPVTPVGLGAGSLWNDGGTVKVV